MLVGIIPNISKEKIEDVLLPFVTSLRNAGIDCLISDEIGMIESRIPAGLKSAERCDLDTLCRRSDMVASIGGDGTMLHTAYLVRQYDKPIFGVNFGKLGFLAEFDMNNMEMLVDELKAGRYTIEERIVLEGECSECRDKNLYALNDIVIDKGGWPKMIELSLYVKNEYVTTFSADGIILATPTGSTGYSLSAGGPVVVPDSDVITVSPISPHSLTMRPLVLSSAHQITIRVHSPHSSVQVNCDGQRVYSYRPPAEITIRKSRKKIKLVHTFSTSYFSILREKLFWGLDARKKEGR